MNPESNTTPFEAMLNRTAGHFRVGILCLVHAIIFSACYVFAYLLRFDFAMPAEFLQTFKSSFAVVVGTQILIGVVFGFYRGWWRYVGIFDVTRLVFGLTTAVAILVAAWYGGAMIGIPDRFIKSPRGVLLIDWSFALLSLFGARVAVRVSRGWIRVGEAPTETVRRVLTIGAGDAGEMLAREIEHRPQLGIKIVGFVDDQRSKWGSMIRGIPVFGPISNIGSIADSQRAREVFIAIPSASGKRIREIIHFLSEADLEYKTIPGIDHVVSGRVHISQLRPVNVEDLLRREQINLPGDPVCELFRGKRVLVTGAGGTIGSELTNQILRFEPERLALVERSEYALYEARRKLSQAAPWASCAVTSNLVDICDTGTLAMLLNRERPQIVLHAAAHKHVPLGEENPSEYLRNNALATRTLAELCVEHGVERFVLISTDKAINPTSVMGATKRAAEILLLDLCHQEPMKLTIVRFGNVIGSSGSVVPLFIEQIAAGGPVTVTHPEVTRYFIRTSEAVALVLQAATLGDKGHVFMLDMGEPLKIIDLARDLIRLSSHSEDEISIIFTGLRPGEKLFEEIRLSGESTHRTVHPQIVVTESAQPDSGKIRHWLARVQANPTIDGNDTVGLICDLVAEYKVATPERQPTARAMRPTPAFS